MVRRSFHLRGGQHEFYSRPWQSGFTYNSLNWWAEIWNDSNKTFLTILLLKSSRSSLDFSMSWELVSPLSFATQIWFMLSKKIYPLQSVKATKQSYPSWPGLAQSGFQLGFFALGSIDSLPAWWNPGFHAGDPGQRSDFSRLQAINWSTDLICISECKQANIS